MKIKSWWLVLLIMILGFTLRFGMQSVSPAGFNADEASLGYNAYSLLKTGKDEWGQSWPIVFRSFNDYKPGVYVYLAIPFVAVFGLTEMAVRLPSILLGTLSILLIYLLAKKLFNRTLYGLAAAFMLAISPWSIHFSRGAWETNVAPFFMLLGIYAFFKGQDSTSLGKAVLKNNFYWYYLTVVSLILAIYVYQSTRIVVPLLGLGLLALNWRSFLQKRTIGLILLVVILLIPFLGIIFTEKGTARFNNISIFSDIGPKLHLEELRGLESSSNNLNSKLFHNSVLTYGQYFISQYSKHFDPAFLFISGDAVKRNNVPQMGQLYLWEIISLIIGMAFLANRGFFSKQSKDQSNRYKLPFLWLIVAPIGSGLTFQAPSALRAENMVMPLMMISGLGLGIIIENITRLRSAIRPVAVSGLLIIILFFVGQFIDSYFNLLPKMYPLEWEYGFGNAIQYVTENQSKYDQVVITSRYDQPYIMLLFYSRFDPAKYQTLAKTLGPGSFGFINITGFDKYHFGLSQDLAKTDKKTLYLLAPSDGNQVNAAKLKTIYYPNKATAFDIIGS